MLPSKSTVPATSLIESIHVPERNCVARPEPRIQRSKLGVQSRRRRGVEADDISVLQVIRPTAREVCDDPNIVDPVLHHIGDHDGPGEFLAVGGDQAGQRRLFAVAVIFDMNEVLKNAGTIKAEGPVLFAMLGIIRERAAP